MIWKLPFLNICNFLLFLSTHLNAYSFIVLKYILCVHIVGLKAIILVLVVCALLVEIYVLVYKMTRALKCVLKLVIVNGENAVLFETRTMGRVNTLL